jgi:hypothetical protein
MPLEHVSESARRHSRVKAGRSGPTLPQQITGVQKVVGFVWWLSGLGFFLFGALNFVTHIGLIIHTMTT